MDTSRQNILIIKLGAFGNIILSLAAFAAIRQHHARRPDQRADQRHLCRLAANIPLFR